MSVLIIFSSSFLGAALVGALFQAPLSNIFGRRVANGAATVIIIISGAI